MVRLRALEAAKAEEGLTSASKGGLFLFLRMFQIHMAAARFEVRRCCQVATRKSDDEELEGQRNDCYAQRSGRRLGWV
jgi:hypothetical protein